MVTLFYRVKASRGWSKAIVAVAHKVMVIAYEILKSGQPYRDLGGDYFDRLNPGRTVRRLTARLERIGYTVTLSPRDAEVANPEKDLLKLASGVESEVQQPVKRKRGRPRKTPAVGPTSPVLSAP